LFQKILFNTNIGIDGYSNYITSPTKLTKLHYMYY